MTSSESILKSKNRAAKGVHVLHVGANSNATEKLQSRLAFLESWEDIVQVNGGSKGVGPQGGAHRLRPALLGVQKLLASIFGEVLDGPFRNPILKMGIDTAKGECLTRVLARTNEGRVSESPIVTVVVCNLDSVLGGVALERSLGFDGLGGSQIHCHQIHKLQTRKMVHEDGGIFITHLGESPFRLAKETWLRGLKLVHGDALPWLGGGENGMLGFSFLSSPRNFRHRPKQAAGAFRRTNISQLLGDFAIERELSHLGEGCVAKAVMPSHELRLVIGRRKGVLLGLLEWRRGVEREGSMAEDRGGR